MNEQEKVVEKKKATPKETIAVSIQNYFEVLNAIDVSEKTEKKNGLTYLSWAWAWGEIKKLYPYANYIIYENKDGLNYHHDGKTAWVKTGVIVDGLEHIEYLPVMDYRNKSITLDKLTSFDVNTAIQRSLTKAVARHGLGLYIYAGEDLPESVAKVDEADEKKVEKRVDKIVDGMTIVDDNDNPAKETLPIREHTLEKIMLIKSQWNADRLARYNTWLLKTFNVVDERDLTELQAQSLYLNISGKKGDK